MISICIYIYIYIYTYTYLLGVSNKEDILESFWIFAPRNTFWVFALRNTFWLFAPKSTNSAEGPWMAFEKQIAQVFGLVG